MSVIIKVGSNAFNEELLDYINAIKKVSLHAFAISQQSIPSLQNPPLNYNDFCVSFSTAQAYCLHWSNQIMKSALSFFKIVSKTNSFNIYDTLISDSVQALQRDPSNKTAKSNLAKSLTEIMNLIKQNIAIVGSLILEMEDFNANIKSYAEILNNIAQNALKDENTNSDKFNEIISIINTINEGIDSDKTLIDPSQVSIGLSITFSLIGIVCLFVPEKQLLGSVILGTSLPPSMIKYNDGLYDLNDQIQTRIQEMNEYSQDILLLQVISISFESLGKSSEASQNAMKTITSMWQSILNDISNVKKALTDVTKDVNTKQDYTNAANDLKAANEAWQKVVYIADALSTINFKWQDKNGTWNSYPSSLPSSSNSAMITIINK